MFRRILIANRGEIALRIVRTCRELGIESLVIHSDADAGSLPVEMADEAISLGDPWCYLDGPRIVQAALDAGAEAIHPGYGFLAENASFARLCREAGLVFIGPPPEVMEHLGEKDRARASAIALGIPCLPGSEPVTGLEEAARRAAEIGYPVIIKAVAGGGGRGMRLVRSEDELVRLLPRAMSEAEAAFKSPAVYLEKYLEGARHVEIQVLADAHGRVVHLGERDCTVQRRHQKLIEESPSPAVTPEVRAAMGEAAVRLLGALGYVNAGTVEFLLDREGRFYFLEVNTRIQVEHPVTEMRFGLDLIAAQIRVASGQPLPFGQDDLKPRGWAIECRINAEDPLRAFAPGPGLITGYLPPAGPGIRVDGAARAGWRIPPFYDSMMAKVIAWAPDRPEALARMARALREFRIEGVPTTIPFHLAVLANPSFAAGRIDTRFAETAVSEEAVRAAAQSLRAASQSRRTAAQPSRTAAPAAAAQAGGGPGAGQADAAPPHDAAHASRRLAAIAAAVAAVIDRPHRIVSVAPVPQAPTRFLWGAAGRFELMARRRLANPAMDRRNHRADRPWPPQTFHDHR
ncbi:MAG: acetyl-CoA carboxylase biotin carboxylase subunit [Bacillota bacterium]|nr:acetyl-CoA carboxylase biotin carboxylase subunit [Bacillota bacterium]REJ34432.1 MAG: acetyl-CoA carboxylase biotin carboxylase subunit [Bacillota bacterium]